MKVFSLFESSLKDPNKLYWIFEQFIIVTVAIFTHLGNSLKKKKNFERTKLAVTPWRAQLRTFILEPVYTDGGGGPQVSEVTRLSI